MDIEQIKKLAELGIIPGDIVKELERYKKALEEVRRAKDPMEKLFILKKYGIIK